MLTAPTMEHLQALKLDTVEAAWTAQQQQADLTALAFDDHFGLLVEAEWGARENKRAGAAPCMRPSSRRRAARSSTAPRRELDKAVIRQLATSRWIAEHHTVILAAATGVGKSFVGCALAHQACRKGDRAGYRRAFSSLHEPPLARADGTYVRLLGKLIRLDVLAIDDWPRPGARPGAPRPPRDPRGSLRHPLDHHHLEPAAAGPVRRLPRRRHPSRCDLRSRPQRPPNRATRTVTAKRRPSC